MSTLAGPFNLFGFIERDLGFYQPVNIGSDTSTNIFTAYRGLISDFTVIGSVIVIFFAGIYFQIVFEKKINTKIQRNYSTFNVLCFHPLLPVDQYFSL